MDDNRIKLANESFQKGYISKGELASVLHQEGALSDDEFSKVNPQKNAVPSSFGQKAYGFAQDTLPYLASAGAGIGASPLGPEASLPAAGLAYAGAKSGLRGLGRIMGYEKPSTLGQEVKQTALTDFPIGTAMETAPIAVKNALASPVAKKLGTGLSEIVSTLPGVESEQVQRIFKNPRSLLPSWLGGPPSLKETGQELGRLQSKYGISGIEERTGSEVLKVKPPTGMAENTVKIADPSRAFDSKVLEDMMAKGERPGMREAIDQVKALNNAGLAENDKQIAARVFDDLKQGKLPEDLDTTVKAIRGIDNRLEKMPVDMTTEEAQNKLLLSKARTKLMNHLADMAPDLKLQRQNYAMGKTREAFTSPGFGLMAQSGGGTAISKMGANRLVGPYALYRMARDPLFGAILGASQSPAVLGAGTALAGAGAKGLQNRIASYIINALTNRNQ